MFKKYHSLENHYRLNTDYLDMNMLVSVTEKIDGSNFSVNALNGEVRFASRNQLVDASWNQLGELVPQEIIHKLSKLSKYSQSKINLYGEVFSSKISKRIPYGDTKVRFYCMSVDDEYYPDKQFMDFMSRFEDNLVVPHKVMTLREALATDVETLKTQYAEDHIAEGIVIKPYEVGEFNDRVPAIKKKSSKFQEKSKVGKEPRKASPEQATFREYINENRVLSYISKAGKMESNKQMGEYIKAILNDAWEDYFDELTDEEKGAAGAARKKITGPAGKIVANWLMKL